MYSGVACFGRKALLTYVVYIQTGALSLENSYSDVFWYHRAIPYGETALRPEDGRLPLLYRVAGGLYCRFVGLSHSSTTAIYSSFVGKPRFPGCRDVEVRAVVCTAISLTRAACVRGYFRSTCDRWERLEGRPHNWYWQRGHRGRKRHCRSWRGLRQTQRLSVGLRRLFR